VNRWKILKTLMLDHFIARYAKSKSTIRWYAETVRPSFAADAGLRLKRLMSWELAEASHRQRLRFCCSGG
jgi:hypothetical protein